VNSRPTPVESITVAEATWTIDHRDLQFLALLVDGRLNPGRTASANGTTASAASIETPVAPGR
jgi:hypothetical protein